MDWTDLYTGSNELADMIVNSVLFAEYRKCKEQLAACKEAQKEIQNFQKMKDKYEEVMRFGKYHPDYTQTRKDMSAQKRTLDLHPRVAAFKKAERDLQLLLSEVSGIFAQSVSANVFVASHDGEWVTKGGCQGGCSTGGSCGCS